ncbi:hypothetical protein EON66_02960 [archaeon]|nr:MAG: hypothetical protein EON66_02960 [archaeon]
MAGVVNGNDPHASRVGLEHVQILFGDSQHGPFEEAFWAPVFAPTRGVQHVANLAAAAASSASSATGAAAASTVHFPRLLFSPPGYTSVLLSAVVDEQPCHAKSALFAAFRAFVLPAFQLHDRVPPSRPTQDDVRVHLIVRRPYVKAGVEHHFMGRQVGRLHRTWMVGEFILACLHTSTGRARVIMTLPLPTADCQ